MSAIDDLLPRELQQAIESRMKRESPLVYAQWANGFTSLTAAFRETLEGMEISREACIENPASEDLSIEIELADIKWRGLAVSFGIPDKQILAAIRRHDALYAKADERNARLIERKRRWPVMSAYKPMQF